MNTTPSRVKWSRLGSQVGLGALLLGASLALGASGSCRSIPNEDSRPAPGSSPWDSRTDSGVPVHTGTTGDTEPAGDTSESEVIDPEGVSFACGEWETGTAPVGEVMIREADLVFETDRTHSVIGAKAADTDGDGCSELMLTTNHQNGSQWLLPGTLAETNIVEERRIASVQGEWGHDMRTLAVGDLDDDGDRDDWLIGAVGDLSTTDDFTGAVYLYLSPLSGDYQEGEGASTIWGPSDSDYFAMAVGAGDTDGDSRDDIAVGWGYYDSSYRSAMRLFRAPFAQDVSADDAVAYFEGDGIFGERLTLDSDLNGDGLHDLVATAFSENGYTGSVYVYYGPVSGTYRQEDADRVLLGEGQGMFTGHGISGGADANRDGYDDIMVAAHASGGSGKVYVVFGPITEGATLVGSSAVFAGGGTLGMDSVSLTQDLDADGYPDPAMGASSDGSWSDEPEGAAYLFYGPVTGTRATHDADAIFYEDDEDWDDGNIGGFVEGLGDTDGDGFDDLLIGMWGRGPAYVFRGGPR